jgi:hypothetical protein
VEGRHIGRVRVLRYVSEVARLLAAPRRYVHWLEVGGLVSVRELVSARELSDFELPISSPSPCDDGKTTHPIIPKHSNHGLYSRPPEGTLL